MRYDSCVSQPAVPPIFVPTIETERLRLRRHQVADFEDCYRMWSDAEVTRHIGGRPFTREEVWARLLRYAGHWAMLGFGFWLIEDKVTGKFQGETGFADFHRETTPKFHAPEAGWALAPHAMGKGFATEALTAITRWADVNLQSDHTVCIINPENVASIRVAEKCGYGDARTIEYSGKPIVLYRRARNQVRS